MLFITANEDSATEASSANFFAGILDDRSTPLKASLTVLRLLLVAAGIVAIPMFKDAFMHLLQHVSAQALHIDETLVGTLLGLSTKVPELSKLFRQPCAEDGAVSLFNCDEE